MHEFAPDRAYLITNQRKLYYTTDTGKSWNSVSTPMEPNNLGIPILDVHPTKADWLIYTGSTDCVSTLSTNCHAVAYYSTNHGRSWKEIERYVKTCSWARDKRLKVDEREIICESYKNKKGSQLSSDFNPMELIAGKNYYSSKIKLFDSVVGFASFSEYLLVAEVSPHPSLCPVGTYLQLHERAGTLSLQVSLDGYHFSEGQFPPSMRIENRVSIGIPSLCGRVADE